MVNTCDLQQVKRPLLNSSFAICEVTESDLGSLGIHLALQVCFINISTEITLGLNNLNDLKAYIQMSIE